jgi:hypothetical protein
MSKPALKREAMSHTLSDLHTPLEVAALGGVRVDLRKLFG